MTEKKQVAPKTALLPTCVRFQATISSHCIRDARNLLLQTSQVISNLSSSSSSLSHFLFHWSICDETDHDVIKNAKWGSSKKWSTNECSALMKCKQVEKPTTAGPQSTELQTTHRQLNKRNTSPVSSVSVACARAPRSGSKSTTPFPSCGLKMTCSFKYL